VQLTSGSRSFKVIESDVIVDDFLLVCQCNYGYIVYHFRRMWRSTLKSRLWVTQGHWKRHHSIDRIEVPIIFNCNYGRISYRFQNIRRKTPIFHIPLYLNRTIPKNPFEFLPKILIQTVQVPELLDCAIILPKSSSLCLECNNVTDRRQTDGSLHNPNVT